MRIIVTGGAGFIGSAVCRHLIATSEAEIVNVDKLTYAGCLASLWELSQNPRYRMVRADICDRPAMQKLFEEVRPHAVMHLAAESHVDRSINGAKDFIDTNVSGTFTLLETARHYWSALEPALKSRFRFLHVSTDEVYGQVGPQGQVSEHAPYDPSSPYAASKAGADLLVMAWHRTYGLPTLISNCSNNYGPYQFPEKLIPLIILNALEGRPLPVYGNGSNVRDWLFVEDHARALELILTQGRPGEIYNVAACNERTNIDVVRSICRLLDGMAPARAPHERLITFVADRPGHDLRYALDPTKIQRDLGWKPAQDFEQGLADTVRWYIENEWWWRALRQRVYSGDRLGLIPPSMQAGRA